MMKIGFMSSVYPKKTLPELLEIAQATGYQGIEFRVEWGHKNGVELAATVAEISDARKMMQDAGIAATSIATGCKFNMVEKDVQMANADLLRQYISLAAAVGAPYLRTFSDGLSDDPKIRDTTLKLAAESYASVDEWAGQHGVEVLIETHTNMLGQYAKQIMDQAGCENLNVLWHIGHHLRFGQSVDEAYPYIRGNVQHLHFGAGAPEAENLRSFELLKADGFEGFFSVEVIDPDDPAQVLSEHMALYNKLVAAVG
jgi:sugar phosphate isomerase/epimerase